jgi:hypothetical protein
MNDTYMVAGDMRYALLLGTELSNVRCLYAPNLHEAFFDHTTKWPRDFFLLGSAIGKLNLLSATILGSGIGAFVGGIWSHFWIGGFLGALLAFLGLPFLLWRRSRFVADIQDWGMVHYSAIVVVIALVVTWMGNGATPTPTALADFSVSWQQGFPTDDVAVTFQGAQSVGKPIERADFSLTVYFQTGQKPVVHQYRELWSPGETVTINLPTEGKIERVDLTGTGRVAGQERQLTGAWVNATKTHP